MCLKSKTSEFFRLFIFDFLLLSWACDFIALGFFVLCRLKRGDSVAGCCDGFCDLCRTNARACRNGMFALMVASMAGHISCVEALIREKADVSQACK